MIKAFSVEQNRKYDEWIKSRPVRNEGVSGGRYTWMYTPTTLGTVIKVRDNCTNEEIDLSDYENW